MWDSGTDASEFVPGLVRSQIDFWEDVILATHPMKDTLLSYLRVRVSVYDFLVDSHRVTSIDHPYRKDAFPGEVFPNRIPDSFADFVGAEMTALIKRGCLLP